MFLKMISKKEEEKRKKGQFVKQQIYPNTDLI